MVNPALPLSVLQMFELPMEKGDNKLQYLFFRKTLPYIRQCRNTTVISHNVYVSLNNMFKLLILINNVIYKSNTFIKKSLNVSNE